MPSSVSMLVKDTISRIRRSLIVVLYDISCTSPTINSVDTQIKQKCGKKTLLYFFLPSINIIRFLSNDSFGSRGHDH